MMLITYNNNIITN